MSTDKPQQQLAELLHDFQNAMLVTVAADGLPRARPLHIARASADGTLYFLVSAGGEVAAELADETPAAVTMQAARKYVSLSGTCRVSQDQELIDRVWNAAAGPWYEQGRNDPNVAVVIFVGQLAEYWKMEAKHLVRFPFEFLRGKLPGKSIDPDDVGTHEQVHLPSGSLL